MRKIILSAKQKFEHKQFLDNVKKLQECKCNLLKPCRKCEKIVTGKEYLKIIKIDNN